MVMHQISWLSCLPLPSHDVSQWYHVVILDLLPATRHRREHRTLSTQWSPTTASPVSESTASRHWHHWPSPATQTVPGADQCPLANVWWWNNCWLYTQEYNIMKSSLLLFKECFCVGTCMFCSFSKLTSTVSVPGVKFFWSLLQYKYCSISVQSGQCHFACRVEHVYRCSF